MRTFLRRIALLAAPVACLFDLYMRFVALRSNGWLILAALMIGCFVLVRRSAFGRPEKAKAP